MEFLLSLQVYGTPEQCYEKIVNTQQKTGAEAFVGVFSYGGMPYDIAEHSMRTFASEVIQELRSVVPTEDQLIARAGTGAAADPSAFRLMVVAT